ncbi:MAG: hypothetical protein CMB79_03515 [Filomicrobium sp.]|nr:hypothetical protein [Filomicrobium sp.]
MTAHIVTALIDLVDEHWQARLHPCFHQSYRRASTWPPRPLLHLIIRRWQASAIGSVDTASIVIETRHIEAVTSALQCWPQNLDQLERVSITRFDLSTIGDDIA